MSWARRTSASKDALVGGYGGYEVRAACASDGSSERPNAEVGVGKASSWED